MKNRRRFTNIMKLTQRTSRKQCELVEFEFLFIHWLWGVCCWMINNIYVLKQLSVLREINSLRCIILNSM